MFTNNVDQTKVLGPLVGNATSPVVAGWEGYKVFHASATAAGAFSVTVTVYGNTSPLTTGGVPLGDIPLSSAGKVTDGLPCPANWPYFYAVSNLAVGSPTTNLLLGG